VKPNLDFAENKAQAQDAVYLMTAKRMGLPMADKSIHGWLVRNEFTEMDYSEEKKAIANEPPPATMGLGVPGPMDVVPGPGGGGKKPAPAKAPGGGRSAPAA
jgi:hypothetical protein